MRGNVEDARNYSFYSNEVTNGGERNRGIAATTAEAGGSKHESKDRSATSKLLEPMLARLSVSGTRADPSNPPMDLQMKRPQRGLPNDAPDRTHGRVRYTTWQPLASKLNLVKNRLPNMIGPLPGGGRAYHMPWRNPSVIGLNSVDIATQRLEPGNNPPDELVRARPKLTGFRPASGWGGPDLGWGRSGASDGLRSNKDPPQFWPPSTDCLESGLIGRIHLGCLEPNPGWSRGGHCGARPFARTRPAERSAPAAGATCMWRRPLPV